jgi:integrase
MVELMCTSGLRWGEAAAVVGGPRPDGNPVDWLRSRIRVVGALTQNGVWKEYPKTDKSRREVPLEDDCGTDMAGLLIGRETTARVFVSPRSKTNLSGANWRHVWYAAIDAINAAARKAKRDEIPRLDPHDCRHTCASWLAQEGVPLYEIQALLGHETTATTQRYAHLQVDAHDRVTDAWSRILAHQRRIRKRRRGGQAG